jgi:alpha-L-fucosidase
MSFKFNPHATGIFCARFLSFCCLFFCTKAFAQQNVHQQSSKYEWPTDEKVKAKLDKWQDQKFWMIIHW